MQASKGGDVHMNQDTPDNGKLKVTVLTRDETQPVPDAVVRITNGANGDVIEELSTDSSGQTPEIDLPAPPLEYSVDGGDTKPYSTYNLTVISSDFETLHIGGVQILPNSIALQNAQVRAATTNGFNVRNVMIDPHTLWGDFPPKIPEDDVKPLPPATGLVVLPRPVVPEFVVVHLGDPSDASAQNVWVYFTDYIKNVASCEIYPTWEAETIKANVLAIVSFTLNRVFTEWYRGQGYEFTITNSTAYDQAFSYGRNFFEDISVIVDDLFTTYVTREGINQPLLTQYCDGRRTQCAGLSQWGSQELGQDGLDAIGILRNYYGSEIFLAEAERVQGVPHSYEGTVLQLGSTGSSVEVIQQQLNRISDNFPAIPKVRVDSSYGEQTQNAVRMFQQIFGLPVTGSVDFATWYAISNIYVRVARLAELSYGT